MKIPNLTEEDIRQIARDEVKKILKRKKLTNPYDLNKVASFLGKRKLK